jgi:hypothetical protein
MDAIDDAFPDFEDLESSVIESPGKDIIFFSVAGSRAGQPAWRLISAFGGARRIHED